MQQKRHALPHNAEEFCQAQQWCLDHGDLLVLDPATELEFDKPAEFTLREGGPFPNGLLAYGARFFWKCDGSWDSTMLTYRTDDCENRNFTVRGLAINGDQTGGAQPSPKKLLCIEGHSGAAVRGFRLADITWEGCQNGIWLEGEVFEGYVTNPVGSWSRNAGIVCRHGYEIPGVLSNVYIIQPNITRTPANMGAAMGILCDRTSSVLIEQGNFISLDGPAIKGTNGVKRIANCDFENTGNVRGVAIEIDTSDFWSQVVACEGSNTQGQMRYLVWHGGPPDRLDIAGCRMYNGGVLAPAELG